MTIKIAKIESIPLREVFYARALEADVQCGALCTKIIERRCTMLGLYTPADCNAAGYRSRDAAGNVNGQNQCPHRTHPE
jgi:predicted Zn-ribbon and HTH transcriptional regulator